MSHACVPVSWQQPTLFESAVSALLMSVDAGAGGIPVVSTPRSVDKGEGSISISGVRKQKSNVSGERNIRKTSNVRKQQSDLSRELSSVELDKSLNNSKLISRINALKSSVNRRHDSITEILLKSKESSDKRSSIEQAFRVCKDAFVEVASYLIGFLNQEQSNELSSSDIKEVIRD